MYRINLHAHSNWSDGKDSVKDMAAACEALGFTACVITDHVYSSAVGYGLTHQAYKEQTIEIATLSDYPIIQGIELYIRFYEEVVIFGQAAIEHLFTVRDEVGYVKISDLVYARSRHDCCINLCHPMNATKFTAAGGHLVVDAYEYINKGKIWNSPYHHYGKTPLANSDAHKVANLERSFNLSEIPLTTEDDVIRYIRAGKQFKLVRN